MNFLKVCDIPTLLQLECLNESFPGLCTLKWDVTLTTHPHLVPRSRMSRSYPFYLLRLHDGSGTALHSLLSDKIRFYLALRWTWRRYFLRNVGETCTSVWRHNPEDQIHISGTVKTSSPKCVPNSFNTVTTEGYAAIRPGRIVKTPVCFAFILCCSVFSIGAG
jgi:hypothetical protein